VTLNITRVSPNRAPIAVDDSLTVLSFIDSSGPFGVNVLGNDSDPDGDSLTVTAVGSAVNGTVTLESGNVFFRPLQNFRGEASFSYEIWDGITEPLELFSSATVTVTVENRPPNSQSPTATTVAGRSVGFAAISTQPDPEFDSVSVTSIGEPSNGSVIASGDTGFEYTPDPGFTGVDTFSFVITDSYGDSANSLATVTVNANTPPVAVDDVATTRAGPTAGEEVFIDVLANDSDPDGDTLEVSVAEGPSNGTIIVSPSGAIRYTPNPGFSGLEQFAYEITDGVNEPVSANVAITVNASLAPVAVDDAAEVSSWISGQGPPTSVQITILDNDSDPDNDVLAYRDVVIVQQPANGSVTFSCVGACNPPEYQPNSGFFGTDTFTYQAVDALGAQSNIATVTVTVTGTNSPPVAVDDVATTRAGPTDSEQIDINVLANDSDPDGDPLVVSVSVEPVNGIVIVTPSEALRYTPNPGFSGIEQITYQITDGVNEPVSANVAITVNADNPPVAVDDSASTGSGPGQSVLIPVFDNDTDPDGDILAYRDIIIVQQPQNGFIEQSCLGACGPPEYSPTRGYIGTDTFTYRAVSPLGAESNIATVTIEVTGSFTTPTAVIAGGDRTIADTDGAPGELVTFDSSQSTDLNDAIVACEWTVNGALQSAGCGTAIEFALPDGENTVALVVIDESTERSAPTSVTITVVPAVENLPPVAVIAGGDRTIADTDGSPGETVTFDSTQSSDPDGEIFLCDWSVNGVFQNGTCGNSVPLALADGTNTVSLIVYDTTEQASAPASVTITVTGANSAPVAADDSAQTGQWISGQDSPSTVQIPVLDNDSDPDGDALAYGDIVIVQQPQNGTLTLSAGPPEYQPNSGFVGVDTFTYQAVDALGAQSNIATVTIDVIDRANGPPVAVADVAQTTVGQPISIDVLANDSDPDGDALTIVEVTPSALGAVAIVQNQIEFTPDGTTGQDQFSYTVADSLGATATAIVNITVIPATENVAPVAVIAGGNRTIADTDGAPGETVTFDSTQSSDQDGQIIFCEWSVNGVPQDAACGNNVPFALADGTSTVSLIVYDDSEQASAPTSVTITVQANAAPVAVIAGGNRTVADSNGLPGEPVVVDGSGSSDASGTIVSYEWSVNGQPVSAATGAQPTLALADGANAVSLTVVDNSGARSTPASVTITVEGANALPVVTISVGNTNIPDSDGVAGENVPFEGSATDTDGTVDTSTFRWTVNDQAVPGANGQVRPILALLNGSNTITLTATDNAGGEGSGSIVVTVGEASVIADLPGIQGNENLESAAGATESTCSALLKADPTNLSQEQVNLRTTCETIFSQVDENPDQVVAAIEQISSQQVTAQQSAAIDYTSAQLLNVAGRLTALRQGTKGVSFAGLNIASPITGVPVSALASLSQTLFGEGGSSGEDEGGLLDDRLGIFINGSLRFGDKDATSRETGFEFDTTGVTIGADYRFTDALVAGLAIGYGTGSADFDNNGGWQDSDSLSGSVYGSWYGNRGYFDGIVTLGSVSYDTQRNIDLFDGAITDRALGSTDGTQWAVGVATGYDFGSGGLRFGPNVALNYIKADIDGFREKTEGTSGLAMAFNDQSADSLALKAGGHLNYSLSRTWGILSPHARFDIVRELANDSQRITVRYANDPIVTSPGQPGGSFVIFTDDPDEYYFLWAVGFSAQFVNGLSGFIDYESTESLDTFTSAEVSFGLRYQTRFR
jgi:uncharacterized protein YhjY with autotransporter beta-barrel domain